MRASPSLTDAGVSEREAEVLALVSEHLTNQQIATRLHLSVRTVESHVSSLLRKLGVADRRALAELAGDRADAAPLDSTLPPVAALPTPLTSFVGRAAERAALAGALTEHRLVTAVGPGGVGKTRLALAVAEDVRSSHAGGARYVDLVPVTDPAMVGAALADSFGFGEQPGRSPTDTVVAKLAGADLLLVLDNCEHLLDGVSALVERLLAASPRIVVLATSRARLRVPFEFVFPVPGMSLEGDPGADADQSDAAALFRERASMTGWTSPYPNDHRRITSICRRLDGMALAIELAAARVATLGLDGLDRGLADPLDLLTGGSRMDQRHRSLRAVIDWSLGLLSTTEQAAIRRASVFASPFTAEAAADVAGFAPLTTTAVPHALASLAEHNLVVVDDGPSGTCYRMLEPIRQYGAELMDRDGEQDDVRARHLHWCLETATRLRSAGAAAERFDEVADELRAALGWSTGRQAWHDEAHQLAVRLAELTYARGKLSESQERYEEAAALASDPAEAAQALHLGAAVAWGRHAGNEAIRLYRAAADAALRAGDPRRAAVELATAAEVITNAPGVMSELLPGEEWALLAEARVLAGGDPQFEAAVLTVTTVDDERDPAYADLAERAVELARRVGDTRLESHALDQVTAVHLICGELDEAVATVRRRLDLLAPQCPRCRDGVGVLGHPAHGTDGLLGRRRSRCRPSLRADAERAAVLPRGGPPRRRVVADRCGDLW